MYAAVVLNEDSKAALRSLMFSSDEAPWGEYVAVESGWEILGDHMTVSMRKDYIRSVSGSSRGCSLEGVEHDLFATHLAWNDRVIAARVDTFIMTVDNEHPHVTLAVNREAGAKPKESNEFTWADYTPLHQVWDSVCGLCVPPKGLCVKLRGTFQIVKPSESKELQA